MNWIEPRVNRRRGYGANTSIRAQHARAILGPVRLQERLAFWRQFHNQFNSTGAIQPSSRFLARAMTEPLRDRRPSREVRVVEMGPGTGAVTRRIAEAMRPGDRLDCFELNPDFTSYLERLVATEPSLAAHGAAIEVHVGDAAEARIDAPADFVVCSVPLNNLPPEAAAGILEAGRRLLTGGGWFTYFEYVGLPRLRKLTAPAEERARLGAVRTLKSRFREAGGSSCLVLRNIPPARAVHVPLPPHAA